MSVDSNRQLRFLFHHRTASKDGQYVHIEELVGSLRAAGHEVIIVGPAFKPSVFGGVASGVSGLRKRLPRAVYEALEFGYSALDFVRLSRVILLSRPDIIYERYNLFLPSGIIAATLFRVPLLLEVNAPLFDERREHSGLSLEALAAWTERFVWRRANRVLAVTAELAHIVSSTRGTHKGVEVIPNGVDPVRFAAREEPSFAVRERFGISPDTLLIGFVGFIRQWHGLEPVLSQLDATLKCSWHLLIVGDGPAREGLETAAHERGIAYRLSVTGVVEREQIPEHIASFDIALQPDVVAYASPLKLFEYMAMGRAIIAADTPNVREILTHETDALLVPRGDAVAIAAAVMRLHMDAPLRRRIGLAAARTVKLRKLHWDENARRVVSIAYSVLNDS